jgi:hypothetical protein
MLERHIQSADVRAVVDAGEIIEADLLDLPLPSFLLLGRSLSRRPLHVVLGL